MSAPRTGPPLRLRCPRDDGTTSHLALDLSGPAAVSLTVMAALSAVRCPCRSGLVLLAADAPEPAARPTKGGTRG